MTRKKKREERGGKEREKRGEGGKERWKEIVVER